MADKNEVKVEAKVSSRSMEAAMVARLFKDALESHDPIVAHFVWERDDGQKLDMGRPKAHPSFPSVESACRRIDERIGQWVSGERPGVDRNAVARLEVGGSTFDFSMESFEKAALADDGSLVVGVGHSKGVGREPMELLRVARLRLYAADGAVIGRKRALVPIKEIIQIKKRESEAQAKRLESHEKTFEANDAGRELAQEEERQWAEMSREPDAAPAPARARPPLDPAAAAMDAALAAVGRNMGDALRKPPSAVGVARAVGPAPAAPALAAAAAPPAIDRQALADAEAKAMKAMHERVRSAEAEAMEQARARAAKAEADALEKVDELAGEEMRSARARLEARISAQERSLTEGLRSLEARTAAARAALDSAEGQAALSEQSRLDLAAAFDERLAGELARRDAAHAQAAMEIGESFERRLASERERLQEELVQEMRQASQGAQASEKHAEDLERQAAERAEELDQALRAAKSAHGEEQERSALIHAKDLEGLRSELAAAQEGAAAEHARAALAEQARHAEQILAARADAREQALAEMEPMAKELAAKMWVESQVRLERSAPAIAVEFVKKVFPPLPLGCDEVMLTIEKAELGKALQALGEHGDYEARLAAKGDGHLSLGVSVPAGKSAVLAEFIATFSKGGVMIRKSGPKPEAAG